MAANWNPSGIPGSGDSLIWDGTSNRETKFNVALTVGAIVMMPAWTGAVNFNTAAITISGSKADFRAGGTFSFTSAKIVFAGTAAQTFIPHGTQTMPAIEQNGTGGTTVSTNGLITSSLTLINLASNGVFNLGTGLTHTIAAMTLNTNGSLNFGSSTLAYSGAAANFSSLTTLTQGTGTLRFTATSGSQVFTPKSGATHPNITHTGPGTLQLATNALTCLSFSNTAGVLDFNGMNITTTSSGNFTINGSGSTLTNLGGRTITVAGTTTFGGLGLNLNPASTWTIASTGSITAVNANIGNSNASVSAGTATDCENLGSNTNWTFIVNTTYYWNRNDLHSSSTDANAAYNWSANADGTGAWPASVDDDNFTADALGSDWTFLDLDADGTTGSYSLTSTPNKLTLTGRGNDIWATSNGFVGIQRSDITGDFDVSVAITASTDPDYKAGIVVANDFSNLASGGYALIAYSAFFTDVRLEVDAIAPAGQIETALDTTDDLSLPVWIRLTRTGTTFKGYYKTSMNGAWTQVGLAAGRTPLTTATNSKIALFSTAKSVTVTKSTVFDDFQAGAAISATNADLSFNGTGASADANATLTGNLAAASLNFTGYTGTFNFGSSTLTVNSGNATFVSGQTLTAGSGTLAFTSGTAQTFTPKSGATFPAVTKSGAGTVTVATNALTAGAMSVSGGTWDWGASTLTHAVPSIATSGSANMTFGSNTVQVTTGNADLSGLGTLTANTGTLAFTAAAGTQVFTPKAGQTHPHFTHTGAGTVQLATNSLTTLSFSHSAGTLDFNGRDITTTSSGNFTVTNGTTTTFTNLGGRTLTVAGNASLTGQSGNLLNLNPGTAWTLTATSGSTVAATYANIANGTVNPSNITGATTNCTDGGGNVRWYFTPPLVWDGGGTDGTCGGGAGDGNKWSCGANWDTDVAPISTDGVIFSGTSTKNCKLDAAVTIRDIAFASGYTGTFDFLSNTLTVTSLGDFRTGGAITPGTGKIAFTGVSPQLFYPPGLQANTTLPTIEQNGTGGTTVTTNRLKATGLILANLASNGAFNLGAGLTDTITTTLTLNTNGGLNFGSSTLVFEGSSAANFSNLSTLTVGSGTLAFAATSGTQTFTPKSGVAFGAITKANAGTVTIATNALTAGALSVAGGTWNWGSSTLTHAVASIATSGSPTMTFGTNTVQVTSGNANLSSLSTLNANTGSLAFTAAAGTQVFTPKSTSTHPSITHSGAGTLQLATNDLTTLGFSQTAGTLDFNGRNITTTSLGNFSLLYGGSSSVSNLGGRTLTVAGNALFMGSSTNYIGLNPGSAWTLNVTGTLAAENASIGNSNASGSSSAGVASVSNDMGGNTNWNFQAGAFVGWNWSTRIGFNTTSSGANVSGNVTNFPLLVRLDSNNFIFTQANSDGSDLRFTDPDGTTLNYEIERWSTTLKKAEIWVKVPQVDGNSDRDYMTMYWGRSTAVARSDGRAVFDTANSFRGVWHLKEDGNNTAGGYADATYAGFNGTGTSMTSSSDVTGHIGMAQDFDGSGDYIEINRPVEDDFTIAFWANADDFGLSGSQWYSGAGLVDAEVGGLVDDFGTSYLSGRFAFGTGTSDHTISSSTSVAPGTWYHVAVTRVKSTGAKVLYVNGNAEATATGSTASLTAPATMWFGNIRSGTNYFNGKLDEIWASKTSRSADWVKLAYQTQKLNTSAVVYPNTALSTFAYSTKIYINTTASGAGTSADVSSFPLLVRLTNANFNFSQAKSDGGDLRFSDSAGNLLSYEIERFDATRKLAEIWVRIPTVKANNNSQWFRMHWGKGTATSIADNISVWGDFKLAYHLNESPGGSSPQILDRSGNSNHGIAQAGAAGDSLTAVIGKGYAMDGSTKHITSERSFVNPFPFTIGTWFKTTTTSGGMLIGHNEYQSGGGGSHDRFIWMGDDGKLYFAINPGGIGHIINSTAAYNDGAWHQVMAKVSSSGQALYVDGVMVAKDATGTGGEDRGGYWRIGYMSTGWGTPPTSDYFNASLDEVWVSHSDLGADYIKLAYHNQKSASTMVQLGTRSQDYAKSVRLNFNTTATGANVAGNVTNFPLLVRLTSSNFDFSVVRSDGTDLQFVDRDGATLYRQVVEWDKANKTGKVWVKVPQVDGNSSTDYITLYYGCSTCTGTPYAVADSVWSGYTSVFHLNAPEDKAYDAAALGNHGFYNSSMPQVDGLVTRNAMQFDANTNGYIDIPNESNYDFQTNISVSAWVKVASWQSNWAPVVTHGDLTWRLQRDNGTNGMGFSVTKSVTNYNAASATNVNDGSWHHVVGVYDGANVKVYVDGVVGGTAPAVTGNIDTDNNLVQIGSNAAEPTRRWNGALSEIRLSNNSSVLSADFIKLSYENQKAADALLSTPITPTTSYFQNSKVYRFNTTSTGANVPGDVTNFPMLIRITGSALCDAVQANAPDIRFLDADGVTWLDYQIERWDQTLDSAEVWVKVPKVDGNSTADFITMYYKQATGVTIPDGQCATCVFSTADGYQGVWHLNNSLSDVTANGITGTNTGSTNSDGVAGAGRNFDGVDDYIKFGNTNPLKNISGQITVEAWIKTSLAAGGSWVSAIRYDGKFNALQLCNDNLKAQAAFWRPGQQNEPYTWNGIYNNNAWRHFVAQYDAAQGLKLWMDGVNIVSQTGYLGALSTSNTTDFTIGASETGTEDWTGKMDEVRISSAFLDSNYIKLSYQNQRRSGSPLFYTGPSEFAASKKYIFNTTKTGANMAADVSNFPLLVRITGSTIVDAVQNNAPDIRFMDGDGVTRLSYQVERWDKTVDSAEVWVLVPKVDGNSETDHITLYYDDVTNGAVADGQCGNCVFDTATFAGVWHLGETGNGTVGEFQDATANVNHGRGGGGTAGNVPLAEPGLIGKAQHFDGTSDYITMASAASLKPAGDMTMSAWVNFDVTATAKGTDMVVMTQKHASASYGSYCLFGKYSGNLIEGSWTNTTPTDFYTDAPGTISAGTWYYLTVKKNSSKLVMFVNGDSVGSTTATPSGTMISDGSVFNIGAWTSSLYRTDGFIDEARVLKIAPSKDFIRLNYETQRRTGNVFWNTRPGPNNKSTLTATANTGSISLAWTLPVTDSSNADSVGIWVKYSGAPDSVGATGQTKVVMLPKTDSTYTYPALYPATYYFALAVRNTSGQWSAFTAASTDTTTLTPGYSMPDTIYLDSSIGNDANTCTQARNPATPIRTLETADGCEAVASDTLVIRVMPGTYSGDSNNEIDPGTKPILVTSFDNSSRAIFAGGTQSSVYNTITFYPNIFLYGKSGIRNLDIMAGNNNGTGVMTAYWEDYQTIEGCRIYNNGNTKFQYGMVIPGTTNYVHVANNIIHQPTTFGIYTDKDDLFNLVHNTLVGTGGAGTKGINSITAAVTATSTIANNILYNWDYGIHTASATAATGVVSNNLFHLVTTGRELTNSTDANMVVRDPAFYSIDIRSPLGFKLLPGSPAIDAGASSGAAGAFARTTPDDAFGTARPQGSARDIGAYEGAGYTPNPTADFDTLTNTVSGNTVIVKNSKWKLVWDMARGGGITGFYDMSADTTANLVATSSLLFDVRIDSHLASTKTSNAIAPAFVESSRSRAVVRQRLALSASMDLNVLYTVHPSGQVYVQSEIANLSAGTLDVDAVQYVLKVGTATAVTPATGGPTGAYLKKGYGFLNTSTKDAFLSVTRDLDEGAVGAVETWSEAVSTAGTTDSVGFQIADMTDISQNMKRHHHFLLYVGDGSLDNAKASTLNADAYTPSTVTASAGSLVHEKSWMEGLSGHWNFDDGAGATALDRSTVHANNAALTSTTWISGKVGGALRFTTSSVAAVTDHDSLEAGQSRTFMLWVKPDFSAMGADAFVMSKGLTTSDGWHFRRVSGLPRIKFVVANREVQSPTLTTGTWVHLVGQVDASGITSLYVNGVLAGASTAAATIASNAANLLFGKGGADANAFAGDIDDARIYTASVTLAQIQAIVQRGYSAQYGHYHLRADNNNRLVALLNESGAQVRVQPAFQIDNWFASRTPKYVYLNGTRLAPNTDYTSDALAGNRLTLQVNKVLTATTQTLFVDDDDSSGFMGEASRMKSLTMSAVPNDKLVIKNFSDTVFGSASSGQWYLELDLNGWANAANSRVTDTGFGEFNVWKAAAISPNLSLGSSTQLVGQHAMAGRSLTGMKFRNATSQIFGAGLGYGGPSNISYSMVDSSATRLSLTLSTMTISASGVNATLVKRWTVYPNGRVIGSFQISTTDFAMTDAHVRYMTRYNSGVTNPWSIATAASTGRWGFTGGDLDFHSLAGAILSVNSAGSTVVSPGSYIKDVQASSANTSGSDQNVFQLRLADALFESADDPITVNFAADISRDFTDSATADSLMKDLQTPAAITAITGTAVTNDALDFNADGFAEGDGAYTFTAAGTGTAHFKYVNTVTHFNPAFRFKSWSFSSAPEVVIVDNQTLTLGYHYNAYVNTGTSELIVQLNRTLSPGNHVFYFSHKTGLAVTLNRFEAVGGEGVDTLLWSTQSELENLGFNVYRRVAAVQDLPDTFFAGVERSAGAGIANALVEAVRAKAAAKAGADTAADSLAGHAYSPEGLKAQGWVRLNPKLLPGAPGGSSAGERNYTYVDRTAAYGVTYEYLLEAVDFSGAKVQYGPRKAKPGNPLETALLPNYPNPFNPITTLRFALKEKSKVSLRIYDAKGRLVRTLLRPDRPMLAGKYRLQWDARDDKGFEVPSGHYFYRLAVPGYLKTRKMILLK